MQCADAIPVARLIGEIGRGLLAPRLADDVEPRAVGREDRIGGVELADEVAGELAARVGEPEEGPGALPLADGEPGLGQELQVAGHPRLRLAEDGDELADRQLGLIEQAEDPQPRFLARRLEPGEEGRKGHCRIVGGNSVFRHKHIFMSNSSATQGACKTSFSVAAARSPKSDVAIQGGGPRPRGRVTHYSARQRERR